MHQQNIEAAVAPNLLDGRVATTMDFPALSQQGTTACTSFYFIFRKEENCHVRIVFARPGCSGCHRYYFDPRSVSLFANPLVLNIVPAVSHEADGLPYIGPD